jgi:hypothetical protein
MVWRAAVQQPQAQRYLRTYHKTQFKAPIAIRWKGVIVALPPLPRLVYMIELQQIAPAKENKALLLGMDGTVLANLLVLWENASNSRTANGLDVVELA